MILYIVPGPKCYLHIAGFEILLYIHCFFTQVCKSGPFLRDIVTCSTLPGIAFGLNHLFSLVIIICFQDALNNV
jgi:hypothetical protein